MILNTKEIDLEGIYPGITKEIERYKLDKAPSCSHCGSNDTAVVMVGAIGRSKTVAAMTGSKLVATVAERLGKYYCHSCVKFFDQSNLVQHDRFWKR